MLDYPLLFQLWYFEINPSQLMSEMCPIRDSLFLEISILRVFLLVVPQHLKYGYYSYLSK